MLFASMKLILCNVLLWRKLADKVASAGYLVVVPDFFYGDPIINFNDPTFDRDSWRKTHNTVSFLLLSCNLWMGIWQIVQESRNQTGHILICLWCPNWTFMHVLFRALVDWDKMAYYLLCMTWTFLTALSWIWIHFPSRIKDTKMPNLCLRLWRVEEFLP